MISLDFARSGLKLTRKGLGFKKCKDHRGGIRAVGESEIICVKKPGTSLKAFFKLHQGGPVDFGTAWRDEDIIGFLLDMRTTGAAVMRVSLNGSVAPPFGVAFDAIDVPYLSPMFTGGRMSSGADIRICANTS